VSATEAELRRLLAGAAFTPSFGFELVSASDGQCTIEAAYRASFERPGGVVSGPVFMAAADVAMWLAILARHGVEDPSVTVDMKTAFLGAARREGFRCTARVLRWGRRVVYGTADCRAADGRLLTHHTVTYMRPDETRG